MAGQIKIAFTPEEAAFAHRLLAAKVAFMMGRKLEEADWEQVYCGARRIPLSGWSNLNVDIIHDGIGIEQKMLRVKSDVSMRSYCGMSLMHPSATRSLRVESTDADPNEVMRDVLAQYSRLIDQRAAKVREAYPGGEPEMRLGWLLWQESLREFLYFEEAWTAPDPEEHYAVWNERGSRGARKPSQSLWVFSKSSDRKVLSVTTSAGIKLQPYFDVPSPNTDGLYIFNVQGEAIGEGLVRVWLTDSTARDLESLLGGLGTDGLNAAILAADPIETGEAALLDPEQVREVIVSAEAYARLMTTFAGVSDEHSFQLLVEQLRGG